MERPLKNYNTLFLDRDGVVNERPGKAYVTQWSQFHFLPGVLEALKILHSVYDRIIIVTNQQGIGKKLMTVTDLKNIHTKMLETIASHGGYVDAVYFCPDLASEKLTCRKPGIVMAKRAKKHFPGIQFDRSIMAGDTKTDMQFGRNAGMINVLIGTEEKDVDKKLVDYHFHHLIDFAKYLIAND